MNTTTTTQDNEDYVNGCEAADDYLSGLYFPSDDDTEKSNYWKSGFADVSQISYDLLKSCTVGELG